MGGLYLTDLADVIRNLGIAVVEVGGSPGVIGTQWKTRARGSGGYSTGRPTHVMMHHTASSSKASGWQDANYCTFGNPNRPVCNLLLGRDAKVYVCAAGATNTNGAGRDPCGTAAPDTMNVHAIGIEASNNGQGEQWSQAMTDTYLRLVRGLCDRYGIPIGRVHSHEEYAPTRKIDPAGPPRFITPPDRPGTTIWNMSTVRAEVGGTTPPPTQPPPTGDWWTPLMYSMPTLTPGMTGVFVKRMQHLIAAAGYMNPANVANYDGVFGMGTAAALSDYKASLGWARDNTCDPPTWGALMGYFDGIPTIVKGNTGADVERMQHLLAAAGFMNEANVGNYDGQWGSGTENAKINFDRAKGLTPSPPTDCGQKSWTRLLKG
jgi:peptidoglycan hydrolase-like protein with peptidoglycan-binding domain